jgi:carbonic anhydrase
MRFIRPQGILLAAALFATLPLWAADRTGILLTSDQQEGTQEQKAEWKAIKKEQDAAMKMLLSGNKYHVNHMVHGKNPRVMVVACSDSHVTPESVFHAQPGDLFVNRAFGNVVDKMILASLEYGAQELGCRVLVVMGHTDCTAVKGAMDEHANPRTEDQWSSLNQKALFEEIEPAVAEVEEVQKQTEAQTGKPLEGQALVDAVVQTNVLNTMHVIRQQSPILWGLENKDYLKIVGCVYHKNSGKVEWIKE